nr:transglycosylase SLT domain-containing protein [uncultured Dorea sp.]
MPDEIDRLEIAVETQANKANRALGTMERKTTRIADNLERLLTLSAGLGNIGNVNVKGLDAFKAELDSIFKKKKEVGKDEIRIRTNRKDLKYPAQSLLELQKRFKDARLEVDFSSKGSKELQKELSKNQRAYERMKQSISDKITLSWTDEIGGKDWYKSVMQMKQYENAVNDIIAALDKLKSRKEIPSFGIEKGENPITSDLQNPPKNISSDAMNYDAGAMKAVFGDGAENIKNFNDLIEKSSENTKSLNNELKKTSIPEESIDTVKQLGYSLVDTADKMNSVSKQSAFHKFPQMIKDSFELNEDGQLPALNKFSDIFRNTIGSMPMKVMDFMKLDESGSLKGIFSLKEKIRNASNTKMTAPDTSAVDEQISKIKREITRLRETMQNQIHLGKFDSAEDTYQDILMATKALKQYEGIKNQAFQSTEKVSAFKRALAGIKGSAKSINSVKKSFNDVSKAVQDAKSMANKAIHPLRTLRELMSGTSNQASKGMSWGKMIGSSLMFSTIFGAISQIKEAIKAGSDNLVQYSSAYNKSISGMVTSLLYLKNAWAAAFAPIINVVAPYISKFIDMIAGALNAVGQFTAALTGKGHVVQAKKAWYDYGKSLESTGNSASNTSKKLKDAKKAAKDLENYTLGIDELHVIQPNKDDSSSTDPNSGSGKYTGPSPSEMFETVEVPNSMNKLSDMFKEAIKNSDFTDIGRVISDKLANALEGIKWNNIYQHADNFGKDLATFLNGLITPRLFYDLGATIAGAINTALHAANSFAINFDWSNFGSSIASSIQGFFENWDAGLTGETFSNFFSGIFDAMTGFLNTLDKTNTFETIGQKLVDFLCGVKWGKMAWSLLNFFGALSKALVKFPVDFAKGVAQEILNKIFGEDKVKLPKVKWFDDLIGWINECSFKQIPLFKYIFDLGDMTDLFKGIKDAIDRAREKMKDGGGDIVKGLGEGISYAFGSAVEWVSEHFPIVKAFKTILGIHSPSKVFKELGGYIMDGLSNGITAKFQPIINSFGDLKESITDKFSDVKDSFGTKFKNARDAVEDKFSDVGDWFANRKNDIKNAHNDIDSSLGSKYKSARTYVNNAFSDVGKWFGDKKTAVQNAQDSISAWFDSKYKKARSNANSSFENIGKWFGNKKLDIQSNMSSISDWFRGTFRSAYNGVTETFSRIGDFFSGIGREIKKPIISAMKAILKGVNWVYERLGGGANHFDVAQLDKYANGTNGVVHDTIGIVNDQAGSTYREMVQFPNGKTIIPKGRNVMLPMPKGTKVLPADQTASLMNMPHFKKGIGDFFGGAWSKFQEFTDNIADYVSNPKKLIQIAYDQFTDFTDYVEPGLSMAKNAVAGTVDTAVNFIKEKLSKIGSSVNYTPSAGVEQWRALAKQALEMTGQFTESNLNRLLMQMRTESGGNPRAINNWDINAKNGVPSKGLMQVIDPTFRAYAQAPYNKDIYDPMSNILAAIRYTLSRYGSLERGWKGHGYADGGFPKVGEMFYANESGPELVGKIGNRTAVVNKTQIVESVSSGVERANDETNALLRTVIEYQKLLLKKETNVNIDGKRADKQISKARRNTGFSFSPT